MQKIDEFIENLLIDKGVTELEPSVRAELKEDMKTRLIDQINRDAVLALSEDKATELAALMDAPGFSETKMTEFMQNSGVNLEEVALDTMLKFRNFYLGTEA